MVWQGFSVFQGGEQVNPNDFDQNNRPFGYLCTDSCPLFPEDKKRFTSRIDFSVNFHDFDFRSPRRWRWRSQGVVTKRRSRR